MKFPRFVLVIFMLLMRLTAQEHGNLIWNDEFDKLDTSKWNIETGVRYGGYNSPDTVKVEDGVLKLCPITKNGAHFTPFLTTEKSFVHKFGYWEMRVKFNTKSGAWSDFWLYSRSVGENNINDSEKYGCEIDVFEHRSNDGWENDLRYSLVHGLHYGGYQWPTHQNVNHYSGMSFAPTKYHIIGFKWTKDVYEFYVDGKLTWRTNKGSTSIPLYTVLSVEVQHKNWAGEIPKEGYNGSPMMEVDYVRVYE